MQNAIAKKIDTVCFTGHREIDNADAVNIPTRLKALIVNLISRGATKFRAGGARGFDTIAALCILELKADGYPQIELELKLPCRDQTKRWNENDCKVYNYIMSQASSVEYVIDHYTSWCMHERNRRLVSGSDVCIAYLKNSKGGTASTYALALSKGLEVINIAE